MSDIMNNPHKYGRQGLAAVNALCVTFLAYHQIPISPELVMVLSGPTILYTAMKGKDATKGE